MSEAGGAQSPSSSNTPPLLPPERGWGGGVLSQKPLLLAFLTLKIAAGIRGVHGAAQLGCTAGSPWHSWTLVAVSLRIPALAQLPDPFPRVPATRAWRSGRSSWLVPFNPTPARPSFHYYCGPSPASGVILP